ncbi:hypothetical protein KIPB_001594 [Kipferlia bialata]|uniref:Uncharacterized protein n=1 Tax=Kipferlia bialata TaxID=797122 RepID=A0A391NS38_9EUKA|nr:hypothetical protein KIPB_001594 [Kipferlia bialata]|eukprot:g1594.t1
MFLGLHVGLNAIEAGLSGGWRVKRLKGEVTVMGVPLALQYQRVRRLDAELGLDSRELAQLCFHFGYGHPYRGCGKIRVRSVQEQWSLLDKIRIHTLSPIYPFQDTFNKMWAMFEGVDRHSLTPITDDDVEFFLSLPEYNY